MIVEFDVRYYNFTSPNKTLSCNSTLALTDPCSISAVSSNQLKLTNIFNNNTLSLSITLKNIKNSYSLGSITPLKLSTYRIINLTQYKVN
jgi:hypothetical protein